MLVLDLSRPLLDLAPKDLVVDDLFSIAVEGCPAACHLEEDHAEGPQVTERSGLGPIEHLRSHIKRRANECFRSFRFLDVLKFFLRTGVERGAVVFTIVECFTVTKVNLKRIKRSLIKIYGLLID